MKDGVKSPMAAYGSESMSAVAFKPSLIYNGTRASIQTSSSAHCPTLAIWNLCSDLSCNPSFQETENNRVLKVIPISVSVTLYEAVSLYKGKRVITSKGKQLHFRQSQSVSFSSVDRNFTFVDRNFTSVDPEGTPPSIAMSSRSQATPPSVN
ncbi:hypothetical protein KSP39_PZI008515 [Platanthera zijinensis]|uniref:Uncharacterized protein n=1 Tax=Platanthera zijinensis TaxID=2320716 RepID=A0AAP0G8Y0_9ASPA